MMKKILGGIGVVTVVAIGGMWLYMPIATYKAVEKSITKLQAKGYDITVTPAVNRDGFVLYPTVTLTDMTIIPPNKRVKFVLPKTVITGTGLMHMTAMVQSDELKAFFPIKQADGRKRRHHATAKTLQAQGTLTWMQILMGSSVDVMGTFAMTLDTIELIPTIGGQQDIRSISVSAKAYGTSLPYELNHDTLHHWVHQGGYIDITKGNIQGNDVNSQYTGRLTYTSNDEWKSHGTVTITPFSTLLKGLSRRGKIPKNVEKYSQLAMMFLGGRISGEEMMLPLITKGNKVTLGNIPLN